MKELRVMYDPYKGSIEITDPVEIDRAALRDGKGGGHYVSLRLTAPIRIRFNDGSTAEAVASGFWNPALRIRLVG